MADVDTSVAVHLVSLITFPVRSATTKQALCSERCFAKATGCLLSLSHDRLVLQGAAALRLL